MTGMLHWGGYRPSWLLRCPCRRRCRGYADGILPAARFWRQQGRYGRRARLSALSLRRRGRLNTYLGSRVVATLLDEMLAADSTASGASVEIDGRRYDEFPVRLAREAGSVTGGRLRRRLADLLHGMAAQARGEPRTRVRGLCRRHASGRCRLRRGAALGGGAISAARSPDRCRGGCRLCHD